MLNFYTDFQAEAAQYRLKAEKAEEVVKRMLFLATTYPDQTVGAFKAELETALHTLNKKNE